LPKIAKRMDLNGREKVDLLLKTDGMTNDPHNLSQLAAEV